MIKKHLSIPNKVEELPQITNAIEELAGEWALSSKVAMNLNLVMEEIVTNIIFYGFSDKHEHQINIEFVKDDHEIKVIISDDGEEFNLLDTSSFEDQEKSAEERDIGGLGIHFVKTLIDGIEYERKGNLNILTLHKNINT